MKNLHLKGNSLRRLRKFKGLTQKDISSKMKIAQSTYARLESGNMRRWTKYLNELCLILEVEPQFLIEEEVYVLELGDRGIYSNKKAS
ncbi:helix-turn-helix domain-containing protein [Flavobacterium sp.]|jgi:transcriptional regulator with XRE-family HTH domain|uniref:helix-turn-helix domain-containing protein n=2 Tax=Flavobacterium sp. TaxID=239 RepID=UPI004048B014